MLLDLLLHRRRELDPRLLEEADGDDLLVCGAEANVEAGVVVVLLQQMAPHGARQVAQVGDVDACRIEAGDHGSLHEPASIVGLAAGDHLRAARQSGAQRDGETGDDLRREIDVHEPRDAVLAE